MSAAVSVVIPVYNAARFLRSSIDSVLAQTFTNFEIIAVDDGSTDRSRAILMDYAARDSRIRVLSRPNTGIVGALNDGIAAACGTFIARMDADDISLQNRLEEQVCYLQQHPECVAVGTDVLYTDPEGAPLIPHHPAEDNESIVAQLLEGNGGALIHPSIMFRSEPVIRVGGYRERYQWIEDLDLYLRLSEVGTLANLPEIHLHYRQHLRSVNHTRGTRADLRLEIVNPYRRLRGLPELYVTAGPSGELQSTADFRRHWAYDAARGHHWHAAWKNATRAVLAAPWSVASWRCWRYVAANR